MAELDLDSFIADIEKSAPPDALFDDTPRCQQCDSPLDNINDDYICPACNTQATHIQRIEETELNFTEDGRPIMGQRIRLKAHTSKPSVDYGWAWSTDEAITHLLARQLDALEHYRLVPKMYRPALTNMWTKYWVENIAIHIKDTYDPQELTDIMKSGTLKTRDIEVLLKMENLIEPIRSRKTFTKKTCSTAGVKFHKRDPAADRSDGQRRAADDEIEVDEVDANRKQTNPTFKIPTSSYEISHRNIVVLTLDKTLAFLDAVSKMLMKDDPLLTSEIIRAASFRAIPYFDMKKHLPEGMKLNKRDINSYNRRKPPSLGLLTLASSVLLARTYKDRLPFIVEPPNFDLLIQRFMDDMNLPLDMLQYFLPIDFSCFSATRRVEFKLKGTGYGRFPIYEIYVYCILLCQLKRLFLLDDLSLKEQRIAAEANQTGNSDNFILYDWLMQLSLKFQLIMSFDPFIFAHPMCQLDKLKPTPQVVKYVLTLMKEEVKTDLHSSFTDIYTTEEFLEELAELINHSFPRPDNLNVATDECELDCNFDIKHPIRDAFERTKTSWLPDISRNKELTEMLFRDFSESRVVLPQLDRNWSVFTNGRRAYQIDRKWPFCFRLLLSVGGFMCFCQPTDLLSTFCAVEGFIYPKR